MLQIKVVGRGCANCTKLTEMCQEVIAENNIEATIEKITDITRFPELGIYLTPGLIVNNAVKSTGKIPTKNTLKHWLMDIGE